MNVRRSESSLNELTSVRQCSLLFPLAPPALSVASPLPVMPSLAILPDSPEGVPSAPDANEGTE